MFPVAKRAGREQLRRNHPHYQIVLTISKGTLDQIELRVETAPDFPFDEIRALEDLKKRLAAALKVEFADCC